MSTHLPPELLLHCFVAPWVQKQNFSTAAHLEEETRANKLSATAAGRAAFLQSLRWGVLSPFDQSSQHREGQIRLALQGGAEPNPHNVMVYTEHSDQECVEKDSISFHLSSGPAVDRRQPVPKSVRAQEKTPRSRRKASSPAHVVSVECYEEPQQQRRS
ncbi:hypothetical protein WMY93_027121 [Mugilogobius chulae]|uniref:Uncharacterized protein n=1 Tax=Mugilogobius chulae TaxID=88201 RepID=A0AAW0N292_9GOBI